MFSGRSFLAPVAGRRSRTRALDLVRYGITDEGHRGQGTSSTEAPGLIAGLHVGGVLQPAMTTMDAITKRPMTPAERRVAHCVYLYISG
jgi:hypothetical protein